MVQLLRLRLWLFTCRGDPSQSLRHSSNTICSYDMREIFFFFLFCKPVIRSSGHPSGHLTPSIIKLGIKQIKHSLLFLHFFFTVYEARTACEVHPSFSENCILCVLLQLLALVTLNSLDSFLLFIFIFLSIFFFSLTYTEVHYYSIFYFLQREHVSNRGFVYFGVTRERVKLIRLKW